MVPDNGSICGAITSSLFIVYKSTHVFANSRYHLESTLNLVSIGTSTNPTYAYYCHDKLTTLSLNYEDTCILLNMGLDVDSKTTIELEFYAIIIPLCLNQ